MPRSWKVVAFETERGGQPIEDFIQSLQRLTIAKVAHTIDLLERHGYLLDMPHIKKMSDELYELRIRGRQEVRMFFVYKKETIILLHGFVKKSQKTPRKHIKTALKRYESLAEI